METIVVTRPMQWANTPDISEVPPLSEGDRECFRELRDVLEKHGSLGRFGINLIHKHFEIGKDEVLVETIDTESRTLTVRPISRADLRQEATETQWQLASGEVVQVCPVYCHWASGHSPYHKQR